MTGMRCRCSPLCAKFHTVNCPKESGGVFLTRLGEEPLTDCFERKGQGGGDDESQNEKQEKVKINLVELAETLLLESPIITDRRTMVMYRFNSSKGIWVDDAEAFIQSALLETEIEFYRPYHLTTLLQIVQGMTFGDFTEPPPNLICVQNGVLDIEKMEMHSHAKDLFFRHAVNAVYDPEASCPKFLKWLEEVLPEPDDRTLIQEMFGYCLYRDYPYHRMFFLVGSGRNGKGTLIRTLQGLIGDRAMASIPLDRLGERFQVTNLMGKLVNVVSEPKISLLNTEIIKQLTGQDLISGEVKGKQKLIEFKNYAKIIVLANRLPPIRDDSVAWWDRVFVVEFEKEFVENQIPNIERNWLDDPKERSGILNWALEGLKRVLKGGFSKSRRMEEIKSAYQKHSNPVRYFISKYCQVGDRNAIIPKSDLYFYYKAAAEEEGLEVVSEERFGRELKSYPSITSTQKRIGGKVTRVWCGIKMKEAILEESVTTVTGVTPSHTPNKIWGNGENKEEEEKLYRNKVGVTPVTPVTPITPITPITPSHNNPDQPFPSSSESCSSCGEYDPGLGGLCRLHNSYPSPNFSCKEFRRAAFRCSCGCGPWKDFRIAQEHLELMGNQGHKIMRW